MCHKTVEKAAVERKWDSLHKDKPWHDGTFTSWAEHRSDSHPCFYTDGIRFWVSDVDYDPDGTWLSG